MLDRDPPEFTKVLRFCGQRLMKNPKNSFFNILKAFCLMKTGKHSDCRDILKEVKAMKMTDPHSIRYLIFIYTAFGDN